MRRATADILPECLIHKILCFLSYEEATKMSVLSKTWLQASLTLPNLKFTVDHSKGNMMKIVVDNIMERYRKGKIPIQKFELSDYSNKSQVFPHIDKWLDVALQNGVIDLDLTLRSYCFPIFTILAEKSLKELVLKFSDLMPGSLSRGVVNCNSLRKLSLSNVRLYENALETLLNSCPFIVSFILKRCWGLKNIELLNLQKIKSVSIETICENQSIKIMGPNLEHLSYTGKLSEGLDVVECQNLKSLDLSYVEISDGFLQHIISRFQFLESLILVNAFYNRWIRFTICKSQSLKILKLRNWKGILEIDAPNLVSIEYEGCQVPELKFARESNQPKHSKLVLRLYNHVNAAWFDKLRKFLSNSTSWSQVSLDFSSRNMIKMNYWQPDRRVAAPRVDVLNLNIRSFKACPDFVDALLLSCYPRRLNLCSSIQMNKFFINRLMYIKNVSHPAYHGRKPWNRKLKEIKAFDVNNLPLQLTSEELAISSLTERKEVYFLLDWE